MIPVWSGIGNYEKNGVVEGKNLVVTEDDASGGLDAADIQQIIENTFDLD